MSGPTQNATPPEVTISDELLAPVTPTIELCYQTFGDPGSDPLLLVMGLGGPMTWWDTELCTQLAAAGFYVIRYDNRDTGKSTRSPGRVRRGHLVRAFVGAPTAAPYSIADLAGDAFGLLDHLGIESAHVVGASMGGMIAQTIAIEHPTKVRSLVSIMSNTGDRKHGKVTFKLMRRMPRLLANSRKDPVGGGVVVGRLVAGPHFDEAEARALIEADLARDPDRTGTARQTVAIAGSPDRTDALGRVTVPTLVVHGLVDPLVKPSGGITTAEAIPTAKLLMFPDMGHDLPQNRWDEVAEAIAANAREAKAVTPGG
jgi:pimeloyl-ACP methyl ester carboxylesterase